MTDRTFSISPATHSHSRPLGRRSTAFTAFTLIELMISIALVLILILGINAVFKYTAQAVGQGQAINTAVRDSRSAQTTMSNDFAALVPNGSAATDSASIIIASTAQPAFQSASDKASDTDGLPLTLDDPASTVSPATYNSRNHRHDMLSFFARNNYHRQTGDDGTYVDDLTSPEAWVWYGHLWLPTNDQSTTNNAFPPNGATANSATYPGEGGITTNPNNVYASQFTLGRVAILLKEPSPSVNLRTHYIPPGPIPTKNLQPLVFDASTSPASASFSKIYQLRFDLAATSIKTLQNQVSAAISGGTNQWWVPTLYTTTTDTALPPAGTPFLRFQANPIPSKPLTAAKMAAATPIFIPGCSQFIVEYAGDFVMQDNNASHVSRAGVPFTIQGDIIGYGPDGQIDYHIGANGAKQINWYGLPRNTSGANTTSYLNGDVVPLYDWLQTTRSQTSNAVVTMPPTSTFEQIGPTRTPANPDWTSQTSGNALTAAEATRGYVCVFGPNDPAPKLIRVTITLNDSAGQLPDGQTYQYVFAVPPQ